MRSALSSAGLGGSPSLAMIWALLGGLEAHEQEVLRADLRRALSSHTLWRLDEALTHGPR